MKVVQYIGGCSVHRGTTSVLWEDSFSTVEVVQYSGGTTSVHAGGQHQYMQGDNISTYGGITSVHAGG